MLLVWARRIAFPIFPLPTGYRVGTNVIGIPSEEHCDDNHVMAHVGKAAGKDSGTGIVAVLAYRNQGDSHSHGW